MIVEKEGLRGRYDPWILSIECFETANKGRHTVLIVSGEEWV